MSKLLFVWAAWVCSVAGMRGGMELTVKFDYFVYFITGNKIDAFYGINDTTKHPDSKWLYCMGVLYDKLTVVTAEMCNVMADGFHWASGAQLDGELIHPVKSVVQGRYSMDFRLVKVKNSTWGPKWAPLGKTEPGLMVKVNEPQLREAADQKTMGIVTTVSRPFKIGAMMMISLEDCSKKFVELIRQFPDTSGLLPIFLPKSVFCAIEAPQPFDPSKTKRRFRRDDTTPAGFTNATTGSPTPTEGPTSATLPPINTGPVTPGVACPDSLGSPFIIKGGKVLGILVAADCHTMNVSFFQSLADDFPTPVDYDLFDNTWTFWPRPSTNKSMVWSPRAPMLKGFTLLPVGWRQREGGFKPFGVANCIAPSIFLISIGLTYSLHSIRPRLP